MHGGFTYRGIHCSTYGLKVTKIEDPLMPPTREKTEEIAGRDGEWDFGADFGPRPVTYTVDIMEQTRADLKANIRNIAAWLNPKDGAGSLINDDEPDKHYLARFAGKIPLDQLINAFNEFSITFIAYEDPMAIGEDLVWEDIVDTGVVVVNNPGTCATKPIITITALNGGMPGDVGVTGGYDPLSQINDTLTNPVLTIAGETITYAGVIAPGASLVIDCDKMHASKGGVNADGDIVGEFPALGPGDNNITMTDDTSTGGGMVKLEYNGRWL